MGVHLIQDSRGRIIAMIPSGMNEVKTTLPGVWIDRYERRRRGRASGRDRAGSAGRPNGKEVELPAELEAIADGHELMKALSGYRIAAGEVKLVRR